MILVGDVGGTTARFALYDDALERLHVETYPTSSALSLPELAARFLAGTRADVEAACFSVAASLPWPVYAHELGEVLELPVVIVVDDLEASATAFELLGPRVILDDQAALLGAALIVAEAAAAHRLPRAA